MPLQAPIIEIFSSFQGEGPRVGERHLFVRFQDCELSCKFCDTPLSFVENRFCRVEFPPFSKRFRQHPNPISSDRLTELLSEFQDPILSITGGEPLQKAAFLKEWLPSIRGRFRILLETAGVHFGEFREIVDLVDIVSMDFKLPSSTGMHPWWREHETFLNIARGKEIYIKVVVTSETEEKDIVRGIELVRSIDPSIPFILQPASPFGRFHAAPTVEQIGHWQELSGRSLSQVRVIPQIHKQIGVL